MREILVNGRWPIILPEHRAARPEWPYWEAQRLAAMRTVIGEGTVVYDIGAEEGDFPGLFVTWGAQVAMAEPNPRVWPNIRAIWNANGFPPPLLAWPGFVGAEEFVPAEEDPSVRVTPATCPWPECAFGELIGDHGFCQLGERPDLPTTTIDTIDAALNRPPDVITMDVEGSEYFVLKGAREVLAERHPDVFVSIHPEFMEFHYAIKDGVEVIRRLMDDCGYPYDEHEFIAYDHEHHWWFHA